MAETLRLPEIGELVAVRTSVRGRQHPAYADAVRAARRERPQQRILPIIVDVPDLLMLHVPPRISFSTSMSEYPDWGTLNSASIEVLVLELALPLSSLRSDLYRRMIELLVEARKKAGITQVELGKRLGQRQTFVSKFELGERRLDVAEFVAVSRAIGAHPYDIIRAAEEAGEH